jgi:hypothetical protein
MSKDARLVQYTLKLRVCKGLGQREYEHWLLLKYYLTSRDIPAGYGS